MPARHCPSQQTGPQAPGIGGGNRLRKEKPDMGAISGTGAFHCRYKSRFFTGFAKCRHIKLPVFFIKIRGQQPGPVVLQHRIDCHHISAQRITANQMRLDHIGCERPKLTVGTLRTPAFLFIAQAMHPFIFADRSVTGLPSGRAVIPACIYIFPPLEHREEILDFLLRGAVCMNWSRMHTLWSTAAPQRLRAYRPFAVFIFTEEQRLSSIQRRDDFKKRILPAIDGRFSIHTRSPSTPAVTSVYTLFSCRFHPDKLSPRRPCVSGFGWLWPGLPPAADPHHYARYDHGNQ